MDDDGIVEVPLDDSPPASRLKHPSDRVNDEDKSMLISLYSNYNFLDLSEVDHLRCCLCLRLTIITYKTACQHLYCRFCRKVLSQILEKKCLVCKRLLQESKIVRDRDIENQVLQTKTFCINFKYGDCNRILELNKMLDHTPFCLSNLIIPQNSSEYHHCNVKFNFNKYNNQQKQILQQKFLTMPQYKPPSKFKFKEYNLFFENISDCSKNDHYPIVQSNFRRISEFPYMMDAWLNYDTGKIHLRFGQIQSEAPITIGIAPLPRVTYVLEGPEHSNEMPLNFEALSPEEEDESDYVYYVRRKELLYNELLIPDGTEYYTVYMNPSILRAVTFNDCIELWVELDYPHLRDEDEPAEGRLIWDILNYEDKKREQREELVDCHSSPYFYSPRRRHRMKVDLYLVPERYLELKIVSGPYDHLIFESPGFFVRARFVDVTESSSCFFTGVFYGTTCRIDLSPDEPDFMVFDAVTLDIEVIEKDDLLKQRKAMYRKNIWTPKNTQ